MRVITGHELRQGRTSLIIWTASIVFLLAVCIFLFPEMKGEMDEVSQVFSSMGSFSDAFGMNQVSFGTLTGFYAIECGNILGLGGAFFAALSASAILAKEEKRKTAEFLFTHPVSRSRVLSGKLLAVFLQIVILNAAALLFALICILAVGEGIPWEEILLMHLAYFLLQTEIAAVCFGMSAFLRSGSYGAGLGLAILFYFCNIIANISEDVEFLKYITPFGYADGADIAANGRIDAGPLLFGICLGVLGIIAAYARYTRKDLS